MSAAQEVILAQTGELVSAKTFQIPTSAEEMRSNLASITGVGFTCQWATAAYVYAWTEEDPGFRSDLAQKSARLTLKDFAALGIRGLSGRNTVAKYRKAWEQAIELDLASDIKPGDVVSVPDIDFASAAGNYKAQGSGQNEWYTPPEYIDMANRVMGGIDLDPASSEEANQVVKAARYFTHRDDGLAQQWTGRVWMNPPYSRDLMPAFVEKLKQSYLSGDVQQAIMVSHNNTDTGWFHSLAPECSGVCFPKNRIKFYRGEDVAAPVNGQAFFYLGENHDAFAEVFGGVGLVLRPV